MRRVGPGDPEQLVRWNFILIGDEILNRLRFVEETLHSHEGLSALVGEHVPRLRTSQEVADAALGEAEDVLAKKSLTYAVLAQELLDSLDDVVRVQIGTLLPSVLVYRDKIDSGARRVLRRKGLGTCSAGCR